MMERIAHKHVEIAQRQIGGLVVTMYWREGTVPPESFVEVQDTKKDDYFIAEVPAGISANEVFNHPFMYRIE